MVLFRTTDYRRNSLLYCRRTTSCRRSYRERSSRSSQVHIRGHQVHHRAEPSQVRYIARSITRSSQAIHHLQTLQHRAGRNHSEALYNLSSSSQTSPVESPQALRSTCHIQRTRHNRAWGLRRSNSFRRTPRQRHANVWERTSQRTIRSIRWLHEVYRRKRQGLLVNSRAT